MLLLLPLPRGRVYVLFLSSHSYLSIIAWACLYAHTNQMPWLSARFYLTISLGLLLANGAVSVGRVAYRNISLTSLAVLQTTQEASFLHVQPSTPWKIRGAQYIYVRFTELGWRLILP